MKIELIKGLSYSYRNLIATTKNPIINCSEDDAKYLCSTGFFKEMVNDTTIPDNDLPDNDLPDNDLSKMSVAELENIATSKNINVKGLKKREIIEKLVAVKETDPDDIGFILETE